jgi:cobyrinic acid a,c-diamide synthase
MKSGMPEAISAPRLLIGGVSSGVGKTTVTVGLCRALQRRGLSVQLFKCGPDYLDPTYHRRVSRRAVHNLDSWLMGPRALGETLARVAATADISLIEGVMGLFDGASPTELTGSSAEIAKLTDTPIALVVDASGMARSVSALAKGFASFEPGIAPAGIICNRVGSSGHLELLRRAQLPDVPVLGGLCVQTTLEFPERHLGLFAAQELDTEPLFEAWADEIDARCDLDSLLALARSAPPLMAAAEAAPRRARVCRIGVAQDAAFHFYYDANLRLLERFGADLVPFSPLGDAALPELDGLYLGGGYPELHGARLQQNHGMRAAIRAHAARGKPIYAECGGLMYLSAAIVDRSGARHEQVGLIDGVAIMQDRLQALGYVEVETRCASPLGAAGARYRGHQFRYSKLASATPPQALAVRSVRSGETHIEGYGGANVLGTYVHGHWAETPAIPEAFVTACAGARR